MAGIFIYSDKNDLVAEILGFAKSSGKPANVICFDETTAADLRNYGADHIYVLKGDSPIHENYGKAVAKFLKEVGAELFAVGATARGRDLAARVAGYLNGPMSSDISSIEYVAEGISIERMTYGGLILQTELLHGLATVTIAAGVFEAAEAGPADISVIKVEADNRVRFKETSPIVRQGADISVAEKLVCVGLGLEKQTDLQLARDLAEVLGAEIACTRGIAEERHWMPLENYIGISGSVVKPKLYLSMGVSGQIQHVIGIRDAKVIAAIDLNEKAPIFKAADYGIVGDMYEIVPLLTEALRQA